MTLRLTIEHSPHPQARSDLRFEEGEMSIGRSADADWQIDDPDMFVSRRHCVISGDTAGYRATDASRGGLFVDGAKTPLGAGNSVDLEQGMRLRLGDVVIRVDLETADAAAPPKTRTGGISPFGADDFFAPRLPAEAPPARPETLPDPFEGGPRRPTHVPAGDETPPPPLFDDPFTLDPVSSGTATADEGGFGDFFADVQKEPRPDVKPDVRISDETADPAPEPAPDTPPERPRTEAEAPPRPPDPRPDSAQDGLLGAFYRGMGIAPPGGDAPSADAMEASGRNFRLMVEGLIQLLRARAREKQNVRVAQTVIGSRDVNPFKFLATTDEVLAALVAPRGEGYLPPDAAIAESFHDLTDHQIRTWTAIQAALRRMIDRFDPEEIERELEAQGRLSALLSGGRNARLWQLYTERYREIAKAAEDRFLGEVGADFRDAYEGNRRKDHD